jgi:hypothetical protein
LLILYTIYGSYLGPDFGLLIDLMIAPGKNTYPPSEISELTGKKAIVIDLLIPMEIAPGVKSISKSSKSF